MLSWTKYEREDEMVEDIDDVGPKLYLISNLSKEDKLFFEELYERELLDIDCYFSILTKKNNSSMEKLKQIRNKVYGFLFWDGFLSKRSKKKGTRIP